MLSLQSKTSHLPVKTHWRPVTELQCQPHASHEKEECYQDIGTGDAQNFFSSENENENEILMKVKVKERLSIVNCDLRTLIPNKGKHPPPSAW